jgi:hypothetical protein
MMRKTVGKKHQQWQMSKHQQWQRSKQQQWQFYGAFVGVFHQQMIAKQDM